MQSELTLLRMIDTDPGPEIATMFIEECERPLRQLTGKALLGRWDCSGKPESVPGSVPTRRPGPSTARRHKETPGNAPG